MFSLGYKTHPPVLELAPFMRVSLHLHLLLAGVKGFFNGYLGTEAPGPLHTALGVACDVVMVAALLTLLVAGTRAALKFAPSRRRVGDSMGPHNWLARCTTSTG